LNSNPSSARRESHTHQTFFDHKRTMPTRGGLTCLVSLRRVHRNAHGLSTATSRRTFAHPILICADLVYCTLTLTESPSGYPHGESVRLQNVDVLNQS
jgi:hypothetical protein